MNKYIVFLFVCFVMQTGCYASDNTRMLEVRRVISKSIEDDCARYTLLVRDDNGSLRNEELCLIGGVDVGERDPMLWIINKPTSTIQYQFPIQFFARKNTVNEVVAVDTFQYPFKFSDYVGFLVGQFVNDEGELQCMLSGKGLLPTKVFKKHFGSIGENTEKLLANRKKLTDYIRNMQKQCQEDNKEER